MFLAVGKESALSLPSFFNQLQRGLRVRGIPPTYPLHLLQYVQRKSMSMGLCAKPAHRKNRAFLGEGHDDGFVTPKHDAGHSTLESLTAGEAVRL